MLRYRGEVKTILFFVVIIAVAGFFVYQYVLEEDDCPKSPTTGECVGTTTGYSPGVRNGGGGGGQTITIEGP